MFLMAIALIGTIVLASCDAAEDLGKIGGEEVNKEPEYLENLQNWNINAQTSQTAIDKFGYDNCFKVITPTDAQWGMYGLPDPQLVNRQDMRFVRSLVKSGVTIRTGELICHKDIANDVKDIFKTLYEQGYEVKTMLTASSPYLYDIVTSSDHPTFGYYKNEGEAINEKIASGKAIVLNVENNKTFAETDKAYKLFIDKGFTKITVSGSSTMEVENAGKISRQKLDYSFDAFVK